MTLELFADITVWIAAFWVSYSYIASLRQVGDEGTSALLESQYSQLERRYHSLFEKVSLLESHSNTYFQSLHEAGLGELVSTRNALGKVLEDIRSLMRGNNTEGVTELIKFLRNPFSKAYPKLAQFTSADLRFLEDWEKRTDDLVISCVVKLGVMQSKNGAIGIKSSRRPTIHTLEELRRTLSEHRVN